MSAKQNNTIKLTKDSDRIGIMDFYDSLTILVKIAAAMNASFKELNELHRPDNGLLTTCLEISTLRHILGELK